MSTIIMYLLFAAIVGLLGFAGYLAWRGRMFSPRSRGREEPRRREVDTASYLADMATPLSSDTARSKSWGSAHFDEAAYRSLLAQLDEIQPSPESPHHRPHVAYMEAVALFAERRQQTAYHINVAAPLVRRISGDERVDCRSVGKARELMLTYGDAVDPRIQSSVDDCEEEIRAYEAMQSRLSEWQVALYALRHRADASTD